jgi:hypothetical protein
MHHDFEEFKKMVGIKFLEKSNYTGSLPVNIDIQ